MSTPFGRRRVWTIMRIMQQNITLFLVVLAPWCAAAAPKQDDHSPITVIQNVNVIDVEAGVALPNRSVVIRGRQIAAIYPTAAFHPPSDARFFEGLNRYLIPGLFDAHVHLTASPETYGPLLLAHGVTCVRDMGAPTDMIIDLRRQAAEGLIDCPRIICTGAMLDGKPPYWPFSEVCDTPQQARTAVRKLHDAGVDQIKLYSRLKPDVFRAAIEEAQAVGLKPVGHVPDAVPLPDAVAAGEVCVEHLTGFERLLWKLSGKHGEDPEHPIWANFRGFLQFDSVDHRKLEPVIKSMREAGTVNCPTIVVMAGIGRAADPDEAKKDPRLEYVPATIRAFWDTPAVAEFGALTRQAVPAYVGIVRMLHDAHVTLMVGTDLANPYVFAGSSVHDEMALFAKAGIPNADILRDATIVPARFCGIDDQIGSVAPGKEASLVLLNRNPLEDIDAARDIESVVYRGRVLDRAALDDMLAHVRSMAKAAAPAQSDVKLDAPGEVISRGRYVVKFQDYDAGDELFVITRTKQGYVVQAHSRPKSGQMTPALYTLNLADDYSIRSAQWRQLTELPTTAEYLFNGEDFTATAHQGVNPNQSQTLAEPTEPWVLSLSAYASKFVTLKQAGLAIGQSRKFNAVGFGIQSSWKLVTSPLTIQRLEDETLTVEGAPIPARHYVSRLTLPTGELSSNLWTDESGLLLRQVLNLPFGTITATLERSPK